ncbi:TREX2 [Branchiostoma lanceolatum]|uniref:TREX2 protein n=1 Tax=Branchiostoma lanceolatum TaxID=7740 RepID=A0A8J9ZPV9_BRALA|nr:TREX2 [Branchiostoma lanceolatum]
MEPIRSFVFLDLEATSCEASARPKITELSLAALHRSALLNPDRRLPRVMDKLLLAVYPNKPIPGPVCELTGLTNENLSESEKPALDASFVAAVCAFLHRQPPPVALVAHNGLRFDFPLLKAELMKLNARLPEGLRFCDSLRAFRETEGGYSLQADVEGQNCHVSPAPREGTALAHESCLGQHDDFTPGTSASKLRNGTTVPSGWDRGTDRAGRVGDVPSGWDRGTDRAGRVGDVPSGWDRGTDRAGRAGDVPSGWDRGTDRAGRVGDVPSGWDRGTDRAGRAGDVPSGWDRGTDRAGRVGDVPSGWDRGTDRAGRVGDVPSGWDRGTDRAGRAGDVPSGWDRGTDRAGRAGDVPSGWDRGTGRAGRPRAGDVPSKRASLSLESLYLRYVSRAPRRVHTAEDDVLALLQVVRARADALVPWMDRNGLAWADIQQMYTPSPVKPAGRISNGDRTGSPARLCLTYED